MKIQPLYDLQQEINRLFIAGSKFAHSDPRLSKFVPVFEKMGEKAPVFKKIAGDIQSLVSSDARESGDKLMALGALLYSILYTQGEALEEGAERSEQQPLFSLDAINTERSYAQLKVLREIAKGGSGRMELMQNAHETGVFKDFRSLRQLDAALEDKYSELADYAENTVIPAAGKSMIPFLMRSFSYEDVKAQARRLSCLIRLDAPGVGEIVDKVFEGSLPGLQVAAMLYLGKDSSNEEFLCKLAKEKNKKVREAAYDAIADIGSVNGLEFLTGLYAKAKSRTNMRALAEALGKFAHENTFDTLFEIAVQSYEELAEACRQSKQGKDVLVAKASAFTDALTLLHNKKRPEVLELISRLVTDEKTFFKLSGEGKGYNAYNFRTYFNNLMRTMDQDAVFAFYEEHCRDGKADNWPMLWGPYLLMAAKRYSAQEIHTVFSMAAINNLLEIRYLLKAVENKAVQPEGSLSARYDASLLDELWAEVLYRCYERKLNEPDEGQSILLLLHSLEPPDSKRLASFLARRAKTDMGIRIAHTVFCIMADRRIKDVDEAVYNYLAKYNDRNGYYLYSLMKPLYMRLPREYALKLKKLSEKAGSYYLTSIVREMLGEEEA